MRARFDVAVSRETRAYLDRAGAAFDCPAPRVAAALLRCIARDDMAGAILDGDDPTVLARLPQDGRSAARGLGPFQQKLLADLVTRRGTDGCVQVSNHILADTLGVDPAQISQTLSALARAGLIERIGRQGARGRPAVYFIPGEPS